MPQFPGDDERSQARRTSDMRDYDRWYCGGKPGLHALAHDPHIWYCGAWKPVPSMAEDCEVMHENEARDG